MKIMLNILNRREIWASGIYNRIIEFIEADREVLATFLGYREVNAMDSYLDSTARTAARVRSNDALRALPFWLRWIFASVKN